MPSVSGGTGRGCNGRSRWVARLGLKYRTGRPPRAGRANGLGRLVSTRGPLLPMASDEGIAPMAHPESHEQTAQPTGAPATNGAAARRAPRGGGAGIKPDATRPSWRATFWEAASILLSATAIMCLVRLLFVRDAVRPDWMLQILLVLGALLATCWGALQRQKLWTGPLQKLATTLPDVRQGKVPIEQLGTIDGGVSPLVPLIQELLRDLRRQKAVVAELEAEISQRVAHRTDALERTIGSLRHQATRDPLTGLFNRRFLDQYLPQAVQRHLGDKGKGDLCVLMIDVDHFKTLNDTLGHAAGDELLKAIGQLIRSSIRGEDVAFRCGGDEFVIVLPGCAAEAARAMAQRLTSLVDALGRTLRVPKRPRLSIGTSSLSGIQDATPERLLEEADRELYEIKSARKRGGEGSDAVSDPTATDPDARATAEPAATAPVVKMPATLRPRQTVLQSSASSR